MKKITLLLTSVFLLTGFSVSSTAKSVVDTDKTVFKWKGSKKVGSHHWGFIKLKSAKASVDGDKISSGEFVMDMTSFTVEDLSGEWEQKFLTHVKTEDFFLVKKWPTAKLVITGQPAANKVSGNLTVKDKTHPVTIPFEKKDGKYVGTLTFDRTKYGITYGSENFFKNLVADRVINNEVEVSFEIVLK